MSTRLAGLAIVALALSACTPKDDATADSTAAATASTALTPAQLAGTWSGTSMPEAGGDSVINRWTVVARPEGGGMFVPEGATDSTAFTSTFDADSAVVSSSPYTDPKAPAGSAQLMFRSIARLMGENKMGGTATIMLANRPDSIVARTRWEATKQ